MGEAYPELKDKLKHIEKVIKAEELSFNDTLDRGFDMVVIKKKDIKKVWNYMQK